MDVQVDICARYNPSEVYLWGKNGLDIRSRTLIFYRQNVISSSHIFTLHHSHRTVTDNLKTYGTVAPLATAVAGVGAINRKSFSRIWTAAKREWCTWLQVTNPAENSSRCQAFGSFPNIYVYPVCPKVQKKTERESHPSIVGPILDAVTYCSLSIHPHYASAWPPIHLQQIATTH